MRKRTKGWLIAAFSLLFVGLVLCAAALWSLNGDFSRLSTARYETATHTVEEDFHSIVLTVDTADVRLVPAEDGVCRVTCFESTDMRHEVSVRDGALTITAVDNRDWYDHITLFSFDSPEVTVYLPAGEYSALTTAGDTGDVYLPANFRFESVSIARSTGDVTSFAPANGAVSISTSTGHIRLEGVTAAALTLETSTGDITVTNTVCDGDTEVHVTTGEAELTNLRCRNFRSTGSTGDLSMENLLAAGTITIRRSTGDVTFDGCDGAEISVTTDTGDVTGSLFSDKIFLVETDTGNVHVPKTSTGGNCEITTDTGDVRIRIA